MNLERRIKAANRTLAAYTPQPADPTKDQQAPTLPYLQWCFSEPGVWDHVCPPLWFIAAAVDAEGKYVYDYLCACGINVSVHSSLCAGLTISKIRMSQVKSAPTIDRSWVLCRWLPPPAREEWIELYGNDDNYPNQGRYIPASSNGRTLTLPEETPPYEESSRYIIQMFKEHEAVKDARKAEAENAQYLKDYILPRRPDGSLDTGAGSPSGSKFRLNRERLKDRMTSFGQIPGQKTNTSFGGVGLIEVASPNVKKVEDPA